MKINFLSLSCLAANINLPVSFLKKLSGAGEIPFLLVGKRKKYREAAVREALIKYAAKNQPKHIDLAAWLDVGQLSRLLGIPELSLLAMNRARFFGGFKPNGVCYYRLISVIDGIIFHQPGDVDLTEVNRLYELSHRLPPEGADNG